MRVSQCCAARSSLSCGKIQTIFVIFWAWAGFTLFKGALCSIGPNGGAHSRDSWLRMQLGRVYEMIASAHPCVLCFSLFLAASRSPILSYILINVVVVVVVVFLLLFIIIVIVLIVVILLQYQKGTQVTNCCAHSAAALQPNIGRLVEFHSSEVRASRATSCGTELTGWGSRTLELSTTVIHSSSSSRPAQRACPSKEWRGIYRKMVARMKWKDCLLAQNPNRHWRQEAGPHYLLRSGSKSCWRWPLICQLSQHSTNHHPT